MGVSKEKIYKDVLASFNSVDGVVDVDSTSTLNPTGPKLNLVLDREKAALHGVAPSHVVQSLYMAGQGHTAGTFHVSRGSTQVPVVVQLAPGKRQRLDQLLQLTVPGMRRPAPSPHWPRSRNDGVRSPQRQPLHDRRNLCGGRWRHGHPVD